MSNKGRDRWGPVVWEWIYRYGKTQARAKNQKTTPRQAAAAAATEAEGEDEGERGGFATRRRPPKRDHQAQTVNSIAFKRSPLLCSTDRVLSFSLPLLPFFSLRRLPRFALIQQCSHAHVNFSCPLGHGRRQRRRDRRRRRDGRKDDGQRRVIFSSSFSQRASFLAILTVGDSHNHPDPIEEASPKKSIALRGT